MNPNLRIIIPTYRRAGAQHTYRALPPEWQERVIWVVDRKDADDMERAHRISGLPRGGKYIVHPDTVKTIAQKRAFILATLAPQMGLERIVMMDDDLRFAVRADPETTKLREARHDDLREHLAAMELLLSSKWPHLGWSARQGNNNHGPTGPDPHATGWAENTRTMYVLGYHMPTVLRHLELGRIEHREDMDYALQLLRAGLPNKVCFTIACDQTYNAPGGASLERTMEASNADADKLAALHPGLVRVVEKEYRASIPRREVVVSWKKAYESSQVQPSDPPGKPVAKVRTRKKPVRLSDIYAEISAASAAGGSETDSDEGDPA